MEGVSLVSRAQYRRAIGMGKSRPPIAKGEVAKFENLHSENLEKKDKNPYFGFKCLHYSVSESVGTLVITIENKSGKSSSIRVKTIDDTARADDNDYVPINEVLQFRDG
jgi:hypothetical protein